MKKVYAKCLLRASAKLQVIVEKIDGIVLKKALASFMDTSPAQKQYEKILIYTHQKDLLKFVKVKLEKIISKFSLRDRIYIDYKYFRKMDKKCYEGIDFADRKYFRRQNALLKKISEKLEKEGVDEKFFKSQLLKISAIQSIYNAILIEEDCKKNNGKKTNIKLKLKKTA